MGIDGSRSNAERRTRDESLKQDKIKSPEGKGTHIACTRSAVEVGQVVQ